jgi:RNA polymerase sigma-70 factor (ECF subfamily)
MPSTETKQEKGSDPEIALVRSAKQGDVTAFEELVRRYTHTLFRVAKQITRSGEDAEEVVQEAFLKAFTHLDTFEERSRFSTWLTRIVVNTALTRIRDPHTARTVSIDVDWEDENSSPSQEIADWRPGPEQIFGRSELADILRRSLESLPQSYGSVFLLRDIEGFSITETAEVLGLTAAAVKTRLLRARLQLRERLSQHFAAGILVAS